MKDRAQQALVSFGVPRSLILAFLLALLVAGAILGLPLGQIFGQCWKRVGMNLILALALLPMIRGGTGLNFGLPLGVVAGLLGCLVALEFNLTGFGALGAALGVGVVAALPIGAIYGRVLNAVRGNEMVVSIYLAFAFVSLFSVVWLKAPFKNPKVIFPIGGSGVRQTLTAEGTFEGLLDDLFGPPVLRLGLLAAQALVFLGVWAFFRTRAGLAIQVAGENTRFAEAAGIRVARTRRQAVTLSTVVAAVGTVFYVESFGLVQVYSAPLMLSGPAVAAVLIGGASLQRCTLAHVFIGVALFHSILVVAPPVLKAGIAGADELTESIRITIQNGMILYALTRKGGS